MDNHLHKLKNTYCQCVNLSKKQCDITERMSVVFYHNNLSTNRCNFMSEKHNLNGQLSTITKRKNSFKSKYIPYLNRVLFYTSLILYCSKIFILLSLKIIKTNFSMCHRCNLEIIINKLNMRMAFRIIILIQLSAIYTYPGYCNNLQSDITFKTAKENYTDVKQAAEDNKSSLLEGFSVALGLNKPTKSSDMQGIDAIAEKHRYENYSRSQNSSIKESLEASSSSSSSSNLSPIFMPHSDMILTISKQNIYKFISRENILKHHQHQNFNLPTDKPHEVSAFTTANFNTCPSCNMREKAKINNLESIKMHILRRLRLTRVPHIPTPMHVPEIILENFYKNYSLNSKRKQKEFQNDDYTKKKKIDFRDYSSETDNISHNIGDDPFAENMQKDDSQAFRHNLETQTIKYEIDFDDDDDDNMEESVEEKFDDDDNYFSHIHSIYIFPAGPKFRHNRKQDVFNFKFENNVSSVSRTILHIYVRGWEYFRNTNTTQLIKENQTLSEIVIIIHRAIRRTSDMNYTHIVKLTESHQKIPTGLGKWVQIEIKQLAQVWRENPNATQGIVVKGAEPWMRSFIVINDKNFPVHIEALTKEKRRHKRSTSLDCQESDNEARCCRYPLKVNFTNFGWHFVVAPTSFEAYFCNGECKVGYLEQYPHTHLASLTTSATPCCSPTKMTSLQLLYFNLDQNLVMSTIPNMSVEKCSCS